MKRKIHIGEALEVLEENSLNILTVTEWADKISYSRSYFCREFTKEFGLNPKDYLKDFRLRLIKAEIQKEPEAIGYKIAINCGFIDEKALHKYLNLHFDLCLSKVKAQV